MNDSDAVCSRWEGMPMTDRVEARKQPSRDALTPANPALNAALSSEEERLSDAEEVGGSSPPAPTTARAGFESCFRTPSAG